MKTKTSRKYKYKEMVKNKMKENIKEVSVLDHGSVILEDVWGSEGRIIDTARLSASDRRVEGQELSDKDINLLKDLWESGHGTPFETMYFRFRMKMPILVARQMVKHRISSWNEMSKRYRGGIGDCYVPSGEALSVDGFDIIDQDDFEDYIEAIRNINRIRERCLKRSYDRIEKAREQGSLPPDTKDGRDPYRARAREVWRGLETVSEYTEVIWTINFRSLSNFFNLRLDKSAQYETRQYAIAIFDCFYEAYPLLGNIVDFNS